ncbi:hypothetical protein HMPREF0591_1712 [Mycobacterium parascrofulaceum ATCC BAA-614]|uniref:Uncharacterized protein n=1 Tax=Mycobacterium parascrofulaceum ATCC BAA-614 TaxID=525368 RepID=D5P6B8_9MYCO|nr:hypothetical protein HMPREF0591_1712 [Mycobacterium parascrofulaceum ATCC BAA-614]
MPADDRARSTWKINAYEPIIAAAKKQERWVVQGDPPILQNRGAFRRLLALLN